MKFFSALAASIAFFAVGVSSAIAQTAPQKATNWPSFRGVNASGVAEGYKTPLLWNADTEDGKKEKNVKWATPIAGLSHGAPIIWGEKLFVLSAVSSYGNKELKVGLYGDITPVEDEAAHFWKVYCLNKRTGKILWERTAYRGVPKVKRHPKATHANSTLATDGKYLVAMLGSEGLYCYDLNGEMLWRKDFGVLDSGYYEIPSAQWGFASSPILHKGRIVVQCDVQKNSFLASLEAKTGKVIWRTPRADVPTWSSPTIVQSGGRTQVAVNGWKHIGGYDFETGKEVWKLKGGGDIPVPTPITAKGLIFITNAHGRMAPIYAVRDTAQGDISLEGEATTNTHIAWSVRRGGGYMQTPLVYGDYLYVCRDNGALSCYEVATGKQVYNERLGLGTTGFTASGVAADGKLYFTSEEGAIFVVKAGAQFQVLAKNEMGEVCMASPALSEGVLYFRTQGRVVAIGEK